MPGAMTSAKLSLAALLGTAGLAVAEARPAPDYFLTAIVASTTAQSLAVMCPELSVDPAKAFKTSETVMERLLADGFDADDPVSDMAPADDALAARQDAFMQKHDLVGAPASKACDAGRAEMAEGSAIGQLLVEVAQ